ncbi:hypothetical protein BOTBODRAFT_38823 [Botryobasidium botryosum FD-172 SS1]|uniref:DUF155 domain-containing protein n=1 Tax=Botryobasidium botryosum (strain FD-172 SS1) TaxID=930990 RepID=A0A067LVP9_BOTB1|nr:hypothetical protein BOTBODRAFT_38823 [Botryobasidium botryosum FD-172 SS1]
MSRPGPPRRINTTGMARSALSRLRSAPTLQPIPESGVLPTATRRAPLLRTATSITTTSSNSSNSGVQKQIPNLKPSQRTSKASQKLVVLPSEPQTASLNNAQQGEAGADYRSEGERMPKAERQRANYRRITAYSTAESFRMKLLTAFLKREHGVTPRVFDEAVYAMYHLPLLPGYGQYVNVRSSAPSQSPSGQSLLSRFSEAEEYGYDGSYFTSGSAGSPEFSIHDGFIHSPTAHRSHHPGDNSDIPLVAEDSEDEERARLRAAGPPRPIPKPNAQIMREVRERAKVAEIVAFEYGVIVFVGMELAQERAILDDFERAGIWVRKREEDSWEIEECHFNYDPTVPYPRIYNDFFTFKSHSHHLTLSLSHALAQSTLLAHFESIAQSVLSSPQTVSIPRQLAFTGSLALRRRDALRLTGRLFKLRRDVNLVSNVLDTPELFWDEASLKGLYDACRDYFEINERVQVLNDKLTVCSDLLDIIHEHLNNGAMIRITWIIIWLIVVACLVELGEVLARLVVHAANKGGAKVVLESGEALSAIERLIDMSGSGA